MSKFPENSQLRTSDAFRKRIKHIMAENDCASNKQFAELIGISTPVISKAVNFGIIPSVRTLVKIADRLELSLKYLLGSDETNNLFPTDSPSSFYARLEELTRENNLNYGQLASKMDFSRTYIYEWIKEHTLPSVDYLLELSDFFKVSPDYLLGRTDHRQ